MYRTDLWSKNTRQAKEFFPTSLCGVLVFRLSSHVITPPPPLLLLSSSWRDTWRGEGGGDEGGEGAALIKSSNPHLAGGEQNVWLRCTVKSQNIDGKLRGFADLGCRLLWEVYCCLNPFDIMGTWWQSILNVRALSDQEVSKTISFLEELVYFGPDSKQPPNITKPIQPPNPFKSLESYPVIVNWQDNQDFQKTVLLRRPTMKPRFFGDTVFFVTFCMVSVGQGTHISIFFLC